MFTCCHCQHEAATRAAFAQHLQASHPRVERQVAWIVALGEPVGEKRTRQVQPSIDRARVILAERK